MNIPQRPSLLFIIGLCLVAAGLPLSKPVISIGIFTLAAEVLTRGIFQPGSGNFFRLVADNFVSSSKAYFRNRMAILFSAIFFIHVIGLAWTTDFSYALKDLRIKLPLFLFPFFFAAAPVLSWKQLRTILLVFVAAVLTSTLIGFAAWKGYIVPASKDPRNIALFVSHIRLALMICLSICILLYYSYHSKVKWIRTGFFVSAVWLGLFLFLLQSLTGVVVLAILVFFSSGYVIFKRFHIYYSLGFVAVTAAVVIVAFSYISRIAEQFPDVKTIDAKFLKDENSRGKKYFHDTKFPTVENGNFVWINIVFDEVREEWKKRSPLDPQGLDSNGNYVEHTLIRFLASKNLPKEKEGVQALTNDEIRLIEQSVTNYKYPDERDFDKRIYDVLWEIDSYMKGGNPSGNSITMRLEFWKNAFMIFKDHPVIGVGTGDIKNVFRNYYEINNSFLSENYRHLRTHNQYLTILVTFGAAGFLIFISALFYPVWHHGRFTDYLFITFFIIGTVSMLNEDTLETQQGVTFFAFFYSMFLFRVRKTVPDKRSAANHP